MKIQYYDEKLKTSFVREASDDELLMFSRMGGKAVPAEVTQAQARLALLEAGKLDAVQPAIDALPEGQREAAQIKWEYAATIRRDDPFTAMLGAAIGLSDEEIDDLFIAAEGM